MAMNQSGSLLGFLPPRAVTALGIGVVALIAIAAGGVAYQVAVSVTCGVAMVEWALICASGLVTPTVVLAPCVLLAALAAAIITGQGDAPVLVILAGAVALAVTRTLLAVGVAFIGLGFVALLALRTGSGGAGDALFLAATIALTDTGAYIGRRAIYTPPIAPRLWPGLTPASIVGGVLGGALAGGAMAAAWGGDNYALARGIIFGGLIGAMAQAGDALEGAVSRQYGREGGGSILPGHDGLLDRVAGLLAAAPLIVLMRLSGHGVQMWQ